MRLFGRNDAYLIVGLTVALLVVFVRPLSRLLDMAREIEQARGLALLPALIILTVLFFFHQSWKRHEMKVHAATSAAEAHLAQERVSELERLVAFGQTLARSLEMSALRDAILLHLPRLAGTDEVWVLLRAGSQWESLVGTTDERGSNEREQLADRATADARAGQGPPETNAQGETCFPMVVGGKALGVLGLPRRAQPLGDRERRVLAAGAALLAVSIKNAQLFREVRENALLDGLTGCVNRAHALEVIDAELRRARRSQTPISLIMFDLDHFKQINDRHGHLCGDAVLTSVGRLMKQLLRGSDLKCRYGGEEFLVLLPETPAQGANHVAETLRRELQQMPFAWNHEAIPITASFGLSAAHPGEIDVEALVARADAALYRAKSEGRNCVSVASESVVA